MIHGILQVKVPVTDLARSAAWYRRAFGLELVREFVEDGGLAGAVLADPALRFVLGLRRRDAVPGRPSFAGFDLFSLAAADRADLDALAARCDDLGVAHGPIVDRGPDGAALDVPDPDGTVVRILTPPAPDAPRFLGIDTSRPGPPAVYTTPRLGTG